MPASFSIPALPSGWPYASRDGRAQEERSLDAALAGLGTGWTLHLRGAVPLEAEPCGLPQAFGRGGILRSGEVVLRPYRRGGLVRHVNDRLYLSPDRFAREDAVHSALWSAGFPTVEPLGYGYRRRAWGVEGVFLTRYVEAAAWPTCWERGLRALPQLLVLLEALAAWDLLAPDLNATNILVTPDDRVLALDWDRAGWDQGQNLRPRYRERLLRSLRKLEAPVELLDRFQAAFSTEP